MTLLEMVEVPCMLFPFLARCTSPGRSAVALSQGSSYQMAALQMLLEYFQQLVLRNPGVATMTTLSLALGTLVLTVKRLAPAALEITLGDEQLGSVAGPSFFPTLRLMWGGKTQEPQVQAIACDETTACCEETIASRLTKLKRAARLENKPKLAVRASLQLKAEHQNRPGFEGSMLTAAPMIRAAAFLEPPRQPTLLQLLHHSTIQPAVEQPVLRAATQDAAQGEYKPSAGMPLAVGGDTARKVLLSPDGQTALAPKPPGANKIRRSAPAPHRARAVSFSLDPALPLVESTPTCRAAIEADLPLCKAEESTELSFPTAMLYPAPVAFPVRSIPAWNRWHKIGGRWVWKSLEARDAESGPVCEQPLNASWVRAGHKVDCVQAVRPCILCEPSPCEGAVSLDAALGNSDESSSENEKESQDKGADVESHSPHGGRSPQSVTSTQGDRSPQSVMAVSFDRPRELRRGGRRLGERRLVRQATHLANPKRERFSRPRRSLSYDLDIRQQFSPGPLSSMDAQRCWLKQLERLEVNKQQEQRESRTESPSSAADDIQIAPAAACTRRQGPIINAWEPRQPHGPRSPESPSFSLSPRTVGRKFRFSKG